MTPAGRGRDLRHLRIGRLVRDIYSAKLEEFNRCGDEKDEMDFVSLCALVVVAVDHLNKVAHYLRDAEERISLAELNLIASYAAERNSSFLAASKYLEHARTLFDISGDPSCNDWKDHRELLLEVHEASAEIERACGNFVEALNLARVVMEKVAGARRLRATNVVVECLGAQSRVPEAVDEACAALSLVGESLPRRFAKLQIRKEVAKLKRSLRTRTSADLVSLPEMTNLDKHEALRLLNCVFRFAWQASDESLLTGTCLRLVRVTLGYGQSKWTPFVYATFAMLLSAYGDVGLGRTFVELALDLLAKRGDSMVAIPGANFVIYSFANHYTQPMIHSLEPLLDAHRIGLETGELPYGSLAVSSYASLYIMYGLSLPNFSSDMSVISQQLRHFRQEEALSILRPCWQFAINLSADSPNPCELTGEALSPADCRNIVPGSFGETHLVFLNFILCYLFDDLELALSLHSRLHKKAPRMSIRSHFVYPFSILYSGLLMFRLSRELPQRRKYRRNALRDLRRLAKLVKRGALNVHPMLCLLQAEAIASKATRPSSSSGIEETRKQFDAAIIAAARSGLTHLEALANERAGVFALVHEKYPQDGGWAGFYLERAVRKYGDMGAFAKIDRLVDEHFDLLGHMDVTDLRHACTTVGVAAKGRCRFAGFGLRDSSNVGDMSSTRSMSDHSASTPPDRDSDYFQTSFSRRV